MTHRAPIHFFTLCLFTACSGAAPAQAGSDSAMMTGITTAPSTETGTTTTTGGGTESTEAPTGGGTTDLPPGTGQIRINELSSSGAADGPYAGLGDLIELYNPGNAAIDLSGWKLADDPSWPADKTYVFPPGTSLAAKEWLVLVALDDVTGDGDFPFGIAQDKEETVVLADADGTVVDSTSFDGAMALVSWCRLPDGSDDWSMCAATFGAANSEAVASSCGDGVLDDGEDCDGAELDGQTCKSLGLGFTGGTLACAADCTLDTDACETVQSAVVLNELEATNDDIELYNSGDLPVDLSGWILTDDVVDGNYDPDADPEKLVFPAQTSLAATGFLVVPKGADPGQHPFGLSGDGDTVTLLKPNLEIVDQVSYAATEADVSYCRLPDGPNGMWTAGCTPTLDDPNQGG